MNAPLLLKLRSHWFYLAASIVVAVDLFFAFDSRGEISLLVEASLLFDLAVVLPCLYWLCYREQGKKSIIRAAAICCLGIWCALKLVPESERELLNYVAPLRYVGIAALACLEIAVLVAIYRAVFKGVSEQEATAKAQVSADLPPWLARLLVLEAVFWRKVWRLLMRFMGGK
jgi:hypothetical protein